LRSRCRSGQGSWLPRASPVAGRPSGSDWPGAAGECSGEVAHPRGHNARRSRSSLRSCSCRSSRRCPTGRRPWTLLLDEFGAVIKMAAQRGIAIVQRGRSHGGQVVVVTQSAADVEALTGQAGLLASLTDNFARRRRASPNGTGVALIPRGASGRHGIVLLGIFLVVCLWDSDRTLRTVSRLAEGYSDCVHSRWSNDPSCGR
jgi:hypothetical protein